MKRFMQQNIQSSLSFNGTSNRLIMGTAGQFKPAPYITVDAWIKTPGVDGARDMMISSRDGESSGRIWRFGINTSGQIYFRIYKDGGTNDVATSTLSITDNQWHHVLGTFDGTNIKVYIDGELYGTTAFSGVLSTSSLGVFYIGWWSGNSGVEWFKGNMAKAALFNGAFTADMVQKRACGGENYTSIMMWGQDNLRDHSTVVHDLINGYSPAIQAATQHTNDVPNVDKGNFNIKKVLVSATAKGASIFNTASYTDNYLVTHNGYQYIVFNDTSLNVMVGRRLIGSTEWTISDTGFNTNTDDDHNVASIGIDANGYIHLSWDHHGTVLNYARSNYPEDISAFTRQSMTGQYETTISYPKFFNCNGFLFFSARDSQVTGARQILNRYNPANQTWTSLGLLVDNGGYSAGGCYMGAFTVDSTGRIHTTFCWRTATTPSILYSHYTYMYSDDNGATWRNSQGQLYTLPVGANQAGDIISGNINLFWPQNHIEIDSKGRPHVAYGKASNRISRDNYFHAYLENGEWHHAQITDFSTTISSLQTFGNYNYTRPNLVIDNNDVVYVIGRIAEANYLRMYRSFYPYTTFEHFKLGNPPEFWGRMEIGGIDKTLWHSQKKLNLTADQGYNVNPDNLYVLEVDLNLPRERQVATGRTAA